MEGQQNLSQTLYQTDIMRKMCDTTIAKEYMIKTLGIEGVGIQKVGF